MTHDNKRAESPAPFDFAKIQAAIDTMTPDEIATTVADIDQLHIELCGKQPDTPNQEDG